MAYGDQAVRKSKACDSKQSAVRSSVRLRYSTNDIVVWLKDTLPSLDKINRVISLDDRMMNRKMAQ